jgi:energy-coupling factor transporter ATP-binding protein EcfA2
VPRAEYRERVAQLLDAAGLAPFRRRLAGQLSGGMKQKLGLVCALIHTPKVLLLDEPTTGVDPVSRRDFWAIPYQLREQGVTIVMSTAYMDEAQRCSRVALLHAGEVCKEALQIWRDPRSLAIALLMPLMQMLLLGYGVSLDIRKVPLCVFDEAHSQASRELVARFVASGW